MRFDRDDTQRDWTEDSGEWTKEEAKRDPRFDFAPFLGPEDLDDQVTDVLDGKDLLDKDAYGEFAPDYIRRRGAPGERGRHEAPGPDPEEEAEDNEEEQFDDGLSTQRFTKESIDFSEDEGPDFQEEPRPRVAFLDEPPPRPKVVAQPAPTVYVDPHPEYAPQEPPSGGGGGNGLKWVIALLISVAVVVGALLFATMILPDLGLGLGGGAVQTERPVSTAPGGMGGLAGPVATSVPTAAPTETPEPTPPPVRTYTVTVTAGPGGSISPSGLVSVQEGGSVSFSIVPDEDYELGQLLIDGANVSVQSSYTFSDVRQDHSIYAIFQQGELPPPVVASDAPTPEPTGEPAPEPTEIPAPEPADTPAPPPEGGEGEGLPPEEVPEEAE